MGIIFNILHYNIEDFVNRNLQKTVIKIKILRIGDVKYFSSIGKRNVVPLQEYMYIGTRKTLMSHTYGPT